MDTSLDTSRLDTVLAKLLSRFYIRDIPACTRP
nr:MAG TPA: hypothetical protein [Caudoviricetes sp.]